MKTNIYDREIMEMLSKANLPICTCVWFTMENKSMVEGYREMAESLIKLEQEFYSSKPPMIELDEFIKAMKAKEKEIVMLKRYMEVHDPLALVKLAFSDMVVEPLVKDIKNNLEKGKMIFNEVPQDSTLFDAKIARMVHIIEDAVENKQVHTIAKALIEKEEELQKLKREHDLAIIKGYTFE